MGTGSRTNRRSLNRRIGKYIKVVLSSTQVLALNTPLQIIAALPNFTHIVEEVYGYCPAQTTGYTIGSATGLYLLSGATTAPVTASMPVTGFIDGTTAKNAYAPAIATGYIATPNTAINAYMSGANVTAGTGPVELRVYFRTLPATF